MRKTAFCTLLLSCIGWHTAYSQTGCPPSSTLPCDRLQVSLPLSLTFDSPVAGTLTDKNGTGTGFTLAAPYSGTRLTQDGTPGNTSAPGYDASKLTISGGQLQLVAGKGIAFVTNNNQINALGVQVDSRNKLQLETVLVNPYNGTGSQQGGVWFGLSDKTFLKLVAIGNKVELRRELNDASSTASGTANPDQRITGGISGLHTKTVRLRLVVDPATNTAEGFYSTDGLTYLNAGAAYPTTALSIAGMGLTASTAYAGIFATYRNGTEPVTYAFESFAVQALGAANAAPVFSPGAYSFSLGDNAVPGAAAGSITATDSNGDALTYTLVSGNTNGAFAIHAATGAITVAKRLNHHTQSSYQLKVRATDPSGLYDEATATINVTAGTSVPSFTTLGWSTVANQPYVVSESQGEAVNGKLYTFGGFDSQKPGFTPTSRAYVFDPAANTWTLIAPMPPMNGTNYGGVTHAGFATDGTDIYFAGGYTANANGTAQIFGTREAWKYIVSEDRYVRLPNLPVAISAGQLEYENGKLHHIGGTNTARTMDLDFHYVLDLDNTAAGWKTLATLPNPRQHAASAVYEGKIYYIGGQKGHDHSLVTQKDVHRYDPATDTWVKMADLPVPAGANGRSHISSSVAVIGNQIVVLGGEISHGSSVSLVSAYTPANNSWISLTNLPANRYSGVAANLGNNIYYTAGFGSRTTYKGIPGAITAQQVASLTLINADSGQPIQTLTSGSTLNLATLPTRNLNVRANTDPALIGSVVFNLSGTQVKNVTESVAPYVLFGDNNRGVYYAWTPATGSYTLKVTPYTNSGGTGTAGTALTVNFTVIDQAATTNATVSDHAANNTDNTSPRSIHLTAYPNPNTGDRIQIAVQHLQKGKQATLLLLNVNGQVLETQKITANEEGKATALLSAGKRLQKGIYLIQVQAAAGKAQTKLAVQ